MIEYCEKPIENRLVATLHSYNPSPALAGASSPEAAPPLSFGHSPNGGTFTKGSLMYESLIKGIILLISGFDKCQTAPTLWTKPDKIGYFAQIGHVCRFV